jgi:hypothetical protein
MMEEEAEKERTKKSRLNFAGAMRDFNVSNWKQV